MADKLRKLKDDAAKLLQKNKVDKALKVYGQILDIDPGDLTALLKCGDIYRKLDKREEAIDAYTKVAKTYAADGLLLKAIAACKLILEIDSEHTDTQTVLAGLYAKKTGRAASSMPVPTKAPPPLVRPKAADDIEMLGDDDILIIDEEPPQDLPTIPLFSDLPKNAFIQLVEAMQMRSLSMDQAIITEGDVDNSMFIISHGKVKVTKTSESGSEIVLAHLGEGAFFGEMALLSESPRTASVIAVEDTQLFEISRATLDQVVGSFPSVKHTLHRFYKQRLLSNLMAISPIFKSLDAEQRKSLIQRFKSREVAPNEVVLDEGQKADGLYILLAGKAEVAVANGGKRQVVAHLKDGDLFGEMELLNNEPIGASVTTLRKSIVLKLPRRAFSEIVSTHPQLLALIADISVEREQTNKAILDGQLKFNEKDGMVSM
ncbi:cyclic nucleotide-binding domain-containing protein [Myxococcota bacterium]|nr:cyclic nucleotide-binding domain-containing protein [Myxococcota bacterium]